MASQKANVLIFSYSSEGMVAIDELAKMMSTFGQVTIKEMDYKRFKSAESSEPVKNMIIEYLLRCQFGESKQKPKASLDDE